MTRPVRRHRAKAQGQANPTVHPVRTADSLSLSIWVPGFRTRTLTVEAVVFPGGAIAGVPVLYLVAGIAVVIVLPGVAVALKRRK